MKRTFEFNDEKSSKFWTIETNDNELTVTFGKIGTKGQTQTKSFADEDVCTKEAEKLIREKTKKGYVEQGETTSTIDNSTKKEKTKPNDNPNAKPTPMKKYQTYVKAYEDEDCIGDEDAGMYVFHIDINDPASIGATLSSVLNKLKDKKFMEEAEDEFPLFAIVENNAVKKLYYDSQEIYTAAVQYEYLRPLVKEICEEADSLHDANNGNPLWENEEAILGVTPAFALAMVDKEHIWTATRALMAAPYGDHSLPDDKIAAMMQKWGACLETQIFFSTMCVNMSGGLSYMGCMLNLGFDEYFKEEDNLNDFLRSWYAGVWSNRFFHLGLGNEYHRNSFLRAYIEPVLQLIFQINDENVKAVADKVLKMMESETIPNIDSIVEQQ